MKRSGNRDLNGVSWTGGGTDRAYGSPIAPADQLAGAIGGFALDGRAGPLHLIRAGALFVFRMTLLAVRSAPVLVLLAVRKLGAINLARAVISGRPRLFLLIAHNL